VILLIDKPSGITSYDVIRRLKKDFIGQKIGHAGTLDPLATGLLIVGTGTDTKKLTQFLKLDKEYQATIKLGVKTDTGDGDGVVIEEKSIPDLNDGGIVSVLKSLVGENEYDLPAYSAVKSGGEPLYKKARRGEKFDVPRRIMKVYSAEFIEYKEPIVKVKFKVGSGTYIRSLAESFGEKLGTVATIKELSAAACLSLNGATQRNRSRHGRIQTASAFRVRRRAETHPGHRVQGPVQARLCRHVSQLRRGQEGLARQGPGHGGQCPDPLFRGPYPPVDGTG